jgi:hypothetical protein
MVGVFLFFDMKTNHDGVRPVVKLACLATLLGVVALLFLFAPRQQKTISPVEATQANQVVTPAEETSNQVETGVVIRTRIQFGVGVGISTNGSN